MKFDDGTKAIQEVIDTDFSGIGDIPTARATLIKLSNAIRDVKISLLFTSFSDVLEEDSLTVSEYLQALNFLDSASYSFKKAALHLDTK